jgi:hypothetical protein
MAWTQSFIAKTVFGDRRCHIIKLTADAATMNIDTGLEVVDGFSMGYCSCATGPQFIYANSGAGGTALMGYLGCSGFTSGDVMFAIVFGH